MTTSLNYAVVPQQYPDWIRRALDKDGDGVLALPSLGTGLLAHAARCVCKDTPELYPGLTGVPGWGIEEIQGSYVQGPFRQKATVSGSAQAITITGESGAWKTAGVGDPNLIKFMPPDATFTEVITGIELVVTQESDAGGTSYSDLLEGMTLTHQQPGAQPYTWDFLRGNARKLADVTAYTLEVAADGGFTSNYHWQVSRLGNIARGIDMKNDTLVWNIPAVTAYTPNVYLRFHGWAIVTKQLRATDQEYLNAAWLDKAFRSYPTGIVGPVMHQMLQRIGTRGRA